jgi:dATP pyrophosphohydrolase
MARALFQVLVFPYRLSAVEQLQYAIFNRSDSNVWQGVAGGGENNENHEQAARREALEEAGIAAEAHLIRLDATASIPANQFSDYHLWENDVYVIPEYSFGIEVKNGDIRLSNEHCDFEWLNYETAQNRLKWDSNKVALWELHRRLSAAISRE